MHSSRHAFQRTFTTCRTLVALALGLALTWQTSMVTFAGDGVRKLQVSGIDNNLGDDEPAELKFDAADKTREIRSEFAEPAKQPIETPLAQKVRRVLDSFFLRPLSARTDTPWSVLHWSIAYGVDTEIKTDNRSDERVSAIGWLCVNNPCAGQRLIVERGDAFQLPVAAGLQGHDGQFLSMLAQARVKEDYVFRVGKRDLTIADLIEYEKQTCRANTELTFKLIGLCHYEGTDAMWKSNRGEEWSVARLLEDELQQPINAKDATCGGLHRLFSISYAAACRADEEKPLTGDWKIAQERTKQYQRRAFELQNTDGSFSTAWLDRREHRSDDTRRLTTSGHILEWLANSLPKDQLHDPKFERAVDYVATTLDGKQGTSLHRGAMGHALHALTIYEKRVLGAKPGDRSARLAAASLQKPKETAQPMSNVHQATCIE